MSLAQTTAKSRWRRFIWRTAAWLALGFTVLVVFWYFKLHFFYAPGALGLWLLLGIFWIGVGLPETPSVARITALIVFPIVWLPVSCAYSRWQDSVADEIAHRLVLSPLDRSSLRDSTIRRVGIDLQQSARGWNCISSITVFGATTTSGVPTRKKTCCFFTPIAPGDGERIWGAEAAASLRVEPDGPAGTAVAAANAPQKSAISDQLRPGSVVHLTQAEHR